MKAVQDAGRTALIRMAIIMVFVAALDATVVSFAQKPLFWAASIPMLIPLLMSFAIWPVIRDSAKSGK